MGVNRFKSSRHSVNEICTAFTQPTVSKSNYLPPKQKSKKDHLCEQLHRCSSRVQFCHLFQRSCFQDRGTQIIYRYVDPLLQSITNLSWETRVFYTA